MTSTGSRIYYAEPKGWRKLEENGNLCAVLLCVKDGKAMKEWLL